MKNALVDGKLGEPGLLRCHKWCNQHHRDVAPVAPWLDVATWLFSKEPNQIYAVQREDYRQIHLGFEGGGMALFDFHTFDASTCEYENVTLIGATGAVYFDDHHNVNLCFHEPGATAVPVGRSQTEVAHLIDAFALSVMEKRPFPATWPEVESAIQVTNVVEQSLEENAPVRFTGGRHD